MKKIIILMLLTAAVMAFSSCADNKAADMTDSDSAYEAMSVAVENGNFQEAMNHYENGAADSGEADINSLYYHAHAMTCYETKGCIGYAYDLISEKSADTSASAKASLEKLRVHTEIFDGVYQRGSYYYVYFSDGKIAIGDGVQLTGVQNCSGELVCIDNVYYWANHNNDDTDTLLYKLEMTDDSLLLTAVDGTSDMYSGEYTRYPADMPELKY